MKAREEQLQQLAEIRSLMERSSRFLSLSGLSGLSAGLIALAGAAAAYFYLGPDLIIGTGLDSGTLPALESNQLIFLLVDGILVLFLAIVFGFYFTRRKAVKKGAKVWDPAAKRLVRNLVIPIAAGGIFALILTFRYGLTGLVAPVTLIFYGLTLINASKYTFDEIRYLGLCEVALGLLATWFVGYGFWFWTLGFGILHIFYGIFMYKKYDA